MGVDVGGFAKDGQSGRSGIAASGVGVGDNGIGLARRTHEGRRGIDGRGAGRIAEPCYAVASPYGVVEATQVESTQATTWRVFANRQSGRGNNRFGVDHQSHESGIRAVDIIGIVDYHCKVFSTRGGEYRTRWGKGGAGLAADGTTEAADCVGEWAIPFVLHARGGGGIECCHYAPQTNGLGFDGGIGHGTRRDGDDHLVNGRHARSCGGIGGQGQSHSAVGDVGQAGGINDGFEVAQIESGFGGKVTRTARPSTIGSTSTDRTCEGDFLARTNVLVKPCIDGRLWGDVDGSDGNIVWTGSCPRDGVSKSGT